MQNNTQPSRLDVLLLLTLVLTGCASSTGTDKGQLFDEKPTTPSGYEFEGELLSARADGHGVSATCEASLCERKPAPACPNYCSECLDLCVQINDCSSCNSLCTETRSCPEKHCTESEQTTCAEYTWDFGDLRFDQDVFDACVRLHIDEPRVEETCNFFARVENPVLAVPAYDCFVQHGPGAHTRCNPPDRLPMLREVDHCELLLVPENQGEQDALGLLNWMEDGLFDAAATCLSIDDCQVAESCFQAFNDHVFGGV